MSHATKPLLLIQIPAEVQAISQALGKNDLATISRIVHSPKASFQVLGLTEVVHLGQAAETLMDSGNAKMEIALLVTRYLQTLAAEIPLMRVSLQSIL